MFIRFNVANFLSFNEMQEFSLIAGKVRNNAKRVENLNSFKLLKFGAVYGANASGKSNLISAIDFMKKTITNGFPSNHMSKYYKGNFENKSKASYFELELKIKDKFYSYGFETILSESRFTSEWLIELSSNGNEKIIFTRDLLKETFEIGKCFKNTKLKNRLNLYAEDLRSDNTKLFLNFMNQFKENFYAENSELNIVRDIHKWILLKLDINYPDRPISNYSYFMLEEKMDEISNFIRAFGTGIKGFEVVEVDLESTINELPKSLKEDLLKNLQGNDGKNASVLLRSNRNDFIMIEANSDGEITSKTIKFDHGNKNVLFDLSEESDGTVRLLDLLEILLDKTRDKIYFIDEIDRCLHPQLTYKFINEFLKLAESRNIQLVVTTHESRLLDFDLLRRDEIWFVDKNNNGESKVYSLDEFNARFDQKVDKAYLEGRYGGVPIFNSLFPLGECK